MTKILCNPITVSPEILKPYETIMFQESPKVYGTLLLSERLKPVTPYCSQKD